MSSRVTLRFNLRHMLTRTTGVSTTVAMAQIGRPVGGTMGYGGLFWRFRPSVAVPKVGHTVAKDTIPEPKDTIPEPKDFFVYGVSHPSFALDLLIEG